MLNVCKQLILLVLFVIASPLSATAASLPEDEKIIAAKFINTFDTYYSFVLTQHKDSGGIKAYTYTNDGNEHSSHDYGVINNIEKAYLVPIDTNSNQHVTQVLIFLETTAGLAHIIDARLNAGILQSFESLNIAGKKMISMPKLLPRDGNNYFLVIAYSSSIEIYSYSLESSLNFLTLLGEVASFGAEEVIQVMSVRGFIIAVTNAFKAYFIGLEAQNIFRIYPLNSNQEIYLRYDRITQKSYLGPSDAVEIQGAPMPYGVISMRRNN